MSFTRGSDGKPGNEPQRSRHTHACQRSRLARGTATTTVHSPVRCWPARPSPRATTRRRATAAPITTQSEHADRDHRHPGAPRLLRDLQLQSSHHNQTTTRLPTPARPSRASGLSHGIETTPVASETAGSPCIIKVRTTAWIARKQPMRCSSPSPFVPRQQRLRPLRHADFGGLSWHAECQAMHYPTSHHGGWHEYLGPSGNSTAGRRASRSRRLDSLRGTAQGVRRGLGPDARLRRPDQADRGACRSSRVLLGAHRAVRGRPCERQRRGRVARVHRDRQLQAVIQRVPLSDLGWTRRQSAGHSPRSSCRTCGVTARRPDCPRRSSVVRAGPLARSSATTPLPGGTAPRLDVRAHAPVHAC